MRRDAPICVNSAACADGEWIGATNCYAEGAAERVCRNAKAQGFGLRENHRRDPTIGQRIGGMVPTSHYGINLQACPGRNGAPEWPEALLHGRPPGRRVASIGGKYRQPYCTVG
jgi:hypothetical protein